jgi:hypothetical protein
MKEETQKELMQSLINCMSFAVGAAWQMIHAHQDPRFIPIRDTIETMKNSCMQIAMGPSDDVAARLRNSGIILPP